MNTKLSSCVAAFLDEQNLGSAEYAKAYQIAIRGWKDLSWDVTGVKKIIPLCMECDYSFDIPSNCLSVKDFGIGNGNGTIASFDKVDTLIGCDVNDKYTHNLHPLVGLVNDGAYVPQPYLGIGSYNSIGKYKVDTQQKKIYISPNCAKGDFYLEGLFHGEVDGDYEINEFASEAIVAYIRWKFNMTGKGTNPSTVNYYKSEYYREKGNAKMRIKKPTIQEMNKSSRESTKMSIRS